MLWESSKHRCFVKKHCGKVINIVVLLKNNLGKFQTSLFYKIILWESYIHHCLKIFHFKTLKNKVVTKFF